MHRLNLGGGGGAQHTPPTTHIFNYFFNHGMWTSETLWDVYWDLLTLFPSLRTSEQLRKWVLHTRENNKWPLKSRFLTIIRGEKIVVCWHRIDLLHEAPVANWGWSRCFEASKRFCLVLLHLSETILLPLMAGSHGLCEKLFPLKNMREIFPCFRHLV